VISNQHNCLREQTDITILLKMRKRKSGSEANQLCGTNQTYSEVLVKRILFLFCLPKLLYHCN